MVVVVVVVIVVSLSIFCLLLLLSFLFSPSSWQDSAHCVHWVLWVRVVDGVVRSGVVQHSTARCGSKQRGVVCAGSQRGLLRDTTRRGVGRSCYADCSCLFWPLVTLMTLTIMTMTTSDGNKQWQ